MESLLRNADLAMYAVKSAGRNGFRFHSDVRERGEGDEEAIDAQSLVKALDGNQFELYYQPVRSVDSSGILFAEVLLRWRHPTRGFMTAGSFIDAADQSGLSEAVGEWVLREACRQQRAWKDAGIAAVPLAVNVSARHFQADSFAPSVETIVGESRLGPGEILFELTESAALKNEERTRETMRRLTGLGIRFIIDDFGAGFFSLRRLNSMPIHALKIDRSLVQHIKGDANNMAIVRAMIALAHALGVEVIAGGVETREQADALTSIGSWEPPSARCDGVQGFFLDLPMPASRFEERISVCGSTSS